MIKSFKAAALTAFAAVFLALPVMAQNVTDDLGPLESNTYKATSGLFGNDVDNYMDVHSFSDVTFEKWFGFLTGDKLEITGNPDYFKISMGFARKFGKIQAGAWYQGNIIQQTPGSQGATTISTISAEYDEDYKTLTSQTNTTNYNESWRNSANQIEFLIGIAGHGIKVGFLESTAKNRNEGEPGREVIVIDNQNGVVDYQNAIQEYERFNSFLVPYIGWGSTFGFASPYVNLGLGIRRDRQVDNYSNDTEFNGVKNIQNTIIGEGHENNFLNPRIGVGSWFDIGGGEESKLSHRAGIEYNLGLYAYRSNYAKSGFEGGHVKGFLDWDGGTIGIRNYINSTETESDISVTVNELKTMEHEFIPTYILTAEPVAGLSLGFQAQVPVSIFKESSEMYTERREISNTEYFGDASQNTNSEITTRNGFQSYVQTEINVALDLAIGASYKLIPNRFTINTGVSARPLSFTNSVTTYKAPANGEVVTTVETDGLGNIITNEKTVSSVSLVAYPDLVQDDQVEVNNVWDSFSGNITGGFTFYFTEKIALDFAASWGRDSFGINIASGHVLLSFKF